MIASVKRKLQYLQPSVKSHIITGMNLLGLGLGLGSAAVGSGRWKTEGGRRKAEGSK